MAVARFSQNLLRRLLAYNPDTGRMTWRQRPVWMFKKHKKAGTRLASANQWNARYAGQPALKSSVGSGYLGGRVFDRPTLAHRVAWVIETGSWPDSEIDHINGDKADNRIENLREATRRQNQKNLPQDPRNKSGFTGVSWSRTRRMWCAAIGVDGRTINLGRYADLSDAIAARERANHKYGFHENHGRATMSNSIIEDQSAEWRAEYRRDAA